jgi:HlyD family secretion protein
MRRTIVLLALFALVTLVAAANFARDPSQSRVDWQLIRQPPREVILQEPARGPITQSISAPGTVEAVEEAEIASQVIGRVVDVGVQDGDHVMKGDLLVRLDRTEAEARLRSAEARKDRLTEAVTQARQDLEKARRDADRLERLNARQAASATELDDARTALAKATTGLVMSQKELAESVELIRTNAQGLEYTEIRAPIDGVAANVDVEVGEVVIAGTTNLPGTVLMTIADLSRMRVRAAVDEGDIPRVRPGQPARVYLQSDMTAPLPGSVDRVAPKGRKADEVVSFETLVALDTDPRIRPAMTATVEIEVDRVSDAFRIPVQAVVYRRIKDLPRTGAFRDVVNHTPRNPLERGLDPEARYIPIVFVERAGRAHANPVQLGLSDEENVEIRSGLVGDERVIVGPFRTLDELSDGDTVVPQTPSP